ncbi:MAG: hypothetical protein QOG73_4138, partial [Acetobacteraceae bacterium]|nr:hypothetical protein [Acetobacteraceae bacterium]
MAHQDGAIPCENPHGRDRDDDRGAELMQTGSGAGNEAT